MNIQAEDAGFMICRLRLRTWRHDKPAEVYFISIKARFQVKQSLAGGLWHIKWPRHTSRARALKLPNAEARALPRPAAFSQTEEINIILLPISCIYYPHRLKLNAAAVGDH